LTLISSVYVICCSLLCSCSLACKQYPTTFKATAVKPLYLRENDNIIVIFAAAADFKVEPKSWVTNDRSFALELIFTVTQKGDLPGLPATGKRFSVRGCSIREFENGKIKGRRDYWDSASLTKQLLREQK
jgi:SnoaL-like polyketide cyclase